MVDVRFIPVTNEPAWILIVRGFLKRAQPYYEQVDYSYINSVCTRPNTFCCGMDMQRVEGEPIIYCGQCLVTNLNVLPVAKKEISRARKTRGISLAKRPQKVGSIRGFRTP